MHVFHISSIDLDLQDQIGLQTSNIFYIVFTLNHFKFYLLTELFIKHLNVLDRFENWCP